MITGEWIALAGIVIQALLIFGGFKYFSGMTNARLDNLEKKMDRHNEFIERLTRAETRIEELREVK